MKITKRQLRRLIKEAIHNYSSAGEEPGQGEFFLSLATWADRAYRHLDEDVHSDPSVQGDREIMLFIEDTAFRLKKLGEMARQKGK